MHATDLLAKLWPLLLVLVIAGVIAAVMSPKGKSREKPKAKRPLTDREQAMFFRLQESLPDHVVMAQVAFSALLDAKSIATRNTFDRKVADFVVCTKAFTVVAVIELDDASHKTKRQADAARERLLTDVGYRVVRFKNVPDVLDVKKAFTDINNTITQNNRIIV